GLGRRARRLDPHPAMDDLRVGENLVEGVDRPGWNPYRLELGQQVGAGPAHGQRGQPSDQLLTVLEPIGIRAIARLLGDFGFTPRSVEIVAISVVSRVNVDEAVGGCENL